jgi:hypothetical protein
MKNQTSPQMIENQAQLSSREVLESLPKWEDLPESNRAELIQALAALLLHDPALQALLEARHEPEQ